MKKRKKTISCLVIFFIVLIGAFLYGRYYTSIYPDPNVIVERVEYTVQEGATFLDVASDLEELGVIKSKLAVQIYLKLEGKNPNIKAGTYILPTEFSVPYIIDILEKGVFKEPIWLTIREGYRYEQIRDEFEEELTDLTQFNSDEFTDIVENPDNYQFSEEIQTFLNTYKPAGKPLRGFLYPDTYRFEEGMSTMDITELMLNNFIAKVENNLDLNNLGKNQDNIDNLYDALILASIIEKESSATDDRADISSVFHNRMKQGIPFQSDATVNFFTLRPDPAPLISETKIDNPYNTYIYAGLTPTPINNPRIKSIIAALEPNSTNYLFFFHNEGVTYFSETAAEHNKKVSEIRGFI